MLNPTFTIELSNRKCKERVLHVVNDLIRHFLRIFIVFRNFIKQHILLVVVVFHDSIQHFFFMHDIFLVLLQQLRSQLSFIVLLVLFELFNEEFKVFQKSMAIIINDLNTIRFGNNLNHWAYFIPN